MSWPFTGSRIASSRLCAHFHSSTAGAPAVTADLVDAPIDLEPVAVGIAELHRDLHAGAPAALEIDRHVVLLQMIARAEHLVERADLEREVIELDIRRGRVIEPTSATP